MTGTGLIGRVAAFAARTARTGAGADRRAATAALVLDAVGNMVLGASRPVSTIVYDVAGQWSGDGGGATVVGRPDGMPPAGAAFVNGTLAHCTDFDDTHLPSLLHPGASVIPAVLAAGEPVDAAGPRLLDAMAIGVELCVRLGMAGYDAERRNSIFFDRGQHATSICGAIGAAVAVATLLTGDADRIAAAGAVAASMGSGLIEANRSGGSVKQVHTGWAAHCGVAAAQLAAAGMTGPPTVLEGRFGFFQAFCGERARPEVVVDGLGERWHAERVRIKPYPCNYFIHAGVECALALRARGVRPEDVAAIELGVAEPALRTIAEPAAAKAAPATGYAAAFSGPYTVAAALAGGAGLGVHVADFTDEAVRRPEVRALAAKVACGPDDECTAVFPDRLAARMRVRLADGRTEEVFRHGDRAGAAHGLTADELELKFRLNCAALDGSAEAVRDEVARLADAASAGSVMAPLRAPVRDGAT